MPLLKPSPFHQVMVGVGSEENQAANATKQARRLYHYDPATVNGIRSSMNVVFVFTTMLFIDDLTDLRYKRRRYVKSFWNPYSFANHLLMLVGLTIIFVSDEKDLDRADISGNHPLNVGVSLTALAIGLEVFKTVRTLVLFEYLGPIVLCVTAVMKDIIRVVAVYAIIFASFTICGWSMVLPFQEAHTKHQNDSSFKTTYRFVNESSQKTWKTLTSAYFWKIVFSDDEGGARIKKWDGKDVDFSLQFSHFIINANWGLYQITMAILMLNILIAIMNTTYAAMWERIDTEWKFSKTCYKVRTVLSIKKKYILFSACILAGSVPDSWFSIPPTLSPVLPPREERFSLQAPQPETERGETNFGEEEEVFRASQKASPAETVSRLSQDRGGQAS